MHALTSCEKYLLYRTLQLFNCDWTQFFCFFVLVWFLGFFVCFFRAQHFGIFVSDLFWGWYSRYRWYCSVILHSLLLSFLYPVVPSNLSLVFLIFITCYSFNKYLSSAPYWPGTPPCVGNTRSSEQNNNSHAHGPFIQMGEGMGNMQINKRIMWTELIIFSERSLALNFTLTWSAWVHFICQYSYVHLRVRSIGLSVNTPKHLFSFVVKFDSLWQFLSFHKWFNLGCIHQLCSHMRHQTHGTVSKCQWIHLACCQQSTSDIKLLAGAWMKSSLPPSLDLSPGTVELSCNVS